MDFNISEFTTRLRELMYNHFPALIDRGKNPSGSYKHGNYNEQIKDVAFAKNPTIVVDENTLSFDIGNEYAEEHYPYYHILEDSPVIRKRNQATDKTKGSQAKVEKLSERNYNKVEWNGKTFTKEYEKNVRGKRNRLSQVSHWATDYAGNKIFINRESNAYHNEHYKYIEKMLNGIVLDQVAIEFNLKRARTQNAGLTEEYVVDHADEITALIGILMEE